MTLHCHNWKAATMVTSDGVKTVCNLRRPAHALAQTPQTISCDTCALRVLREGQDRGLSEDAIKSWTWEMLGASEPPKGEL